MTYACADCPVPGTCIGKGLPSCTQVKRQYREKQRAAGWQSIETVPKDGSFFVVWDAQYNEPEIVRWSAYEEEWLVRGIGSTDDLPESYSHWMPLPAPPEQN